MNYDCLNIDNIVDDWYGLSNTSILSVPQDILKNKEINKLKPPSGLSIANVLNKIFRISKDKTITAIEKRHYIIYIN